MGNEVLTITPLVTEEAEFEIIEPAKEYYLGVDYYKKDYSMCVLAKKVGVNDIGGEVIAMYKGRAETPKDFEIEVAKVAEYYKIPENHILKDF